MTIEEIIIKHIPEAGIAIGEECWAANADATANIGVIRKILTEYGEAIREEQIKLCQAWATSALLSKDGCSYSILEKFYNHIGQTIRTEVK